MTAILQTTGVSFCYPGAALALDNLSVAFAEGRRTAVLGRNGSGKSTLFTLLNGLQRPHQGAVLFRGEPLRYDRGALKSLRGKVGMVFQEPDSQLFSASIREDVSFGPMNLGLSATEVRSRVEEALATVGLADLAGRPVHALSHGEKKRVCLAGVLAMHPEVLILDEPAAGLDPVMTRALTAILEQCHARGVTVLLATHDVDFAYAWADDICLLDAGTLVFHGSVDAFAALLPRLPDLGLELPWVLQMYQLLGRNGYIDLTASPPRSKATLMQLLSRFGKTE